MNNFVFGQYLPGTSLIHRMNPSSKILLGIFWILVILLSNNWIGNLILAASVGITIGISQIPVRIVLRSVKPLIILIFITTLFQLLFSPGRKVIYHWKMIRITQTGLSNGGLILIRLLLIIGISTVLTLSTSPIEIADGIRALLYPLRKWKVPVTTISLMIFISLRFIPILEREFQIVTRAQRSRGISDRRNPWWRKIDRIAKLLMPVLFRSFNQAQILSYAMISRGYRSGIKRTHYRNYSWSNRDTLSWIVTLIVGWLVLLFRK